MKTHLFALCLANLAFAACTSTTAMQRPADAKAAMLDEVRRVDTQRLASSVAADLPALRALFADELTYCHSNAYCESGASLLTRIGAGELKYLKLESTAQDAEQVGDVVLLHGKVNMQAQNGPQAVSMGLSYLAVYERRAGHWQLRAYQSTRMP